MMVGRGDGKSAVGVQNGGGPEIEHLQREKSKENLMRRFQLPSQSFADGEDARPGIDLLHKVNFLLREGEPLHAFVA